MEHKNTAWIQYGDEGNPIAVVLNCPGKTEYKKQCPAVGQTGKNLERLLKLLKASPSLEKDARFFEKDYIEIVNASKIAHFASARENGKDAAPGKWKKSEVEKNVSFVKGRLLNTKIKHILCFGAGAKLAIKLISKNLTSDEKKTFSKRKILQCCHLSNQGIATPKSGYNWKTNERMTRLKEVADFIAENWGGQGISEFSRKKSC